MRQGTLSRLTVITQIPGHDSIAAAARAIYGGHDSALRQMVHKIEKAAGFTIIDRTSTPLAPTTGRRAHPRSTPDPPGRSGTRPADA
jgi:hypothetical protein